MKTTQGTFCLTLFLASASAFALPIPPAGTEGLSIAVATDGDVVATFQGSSAAYSDDLILNGNVIFNNHASAIGSTVNLGSFSAGTVLDFSIFVHNTGNTFYSGPAALNPDGKAHARVQNEWAPNTTLVSFEDLDHGVFDYNDLSFSFNNTVAATPDVPIPAAAWLFASGLVGLTIMRRKID